MPTVQNHRQVSSNPIPSSRVESGAPAQVAVLSPVELEKNHMATHAANVFAGGGKASSADVVRLVTPAETGAKSPLSLRLENASTVGFVDSKKAQDEALAALLRVEQHPGDAKATLKFANEIAEKSAIPLAEAVGSYLSLLQALGGATETERAAEAMSLIYRNFGAHGSAFVEALIGTLAPIAATAGREQTATEQLPFPLTSELFGRFMNAYTNLAKPRGFTDPKAFIAAITAETELVRQSVTASDANVPSLIAKRLRASIDAATLPQNISDKFKELLPYIGIEHPTKADIDEIAKKLGTIGAGALSSTTARTGLQELTKFRDSVQENTRRFPTREELLAALDRVAEKSLALSVAPNNPSQFSDLTERLLAEHFSP